MVITHDALHVMDHAGSLEFPGVLRGGDMRSGLSCPWVPGFYAWPRTPRASATLETMRQEFRVDEAALLAPPFRT